MSNHSGFVPLVLMIPLLVIWIGNLVVRGWQTTYTILYLYISLYVYKAKLSDDERCPYIETVSKSQVLHSCRSRAMEPLGHQTPGPWLVSPFFCFDHHVAMDQYLWKYHFWRDEHPFTSINPSYFDVHYRGTIGFDTDHHVFVSRSDPPHFHCSFRENDHHIFDGHILIARLQNTRAAMT